MSAPKLSVSANALPTSVLKAVASATARIAPSWPLERMIAVNPWWGFVDKPIEDACATLEFLSGTQCTMPDSWYAARASTETNSHAGTRGLNAERSDAADTRSANTLQQQASHATAERLPLITDVADRERAGHRQVRWTDFVLNQLSRATAACLGNGPGLWMPTQAQSHNLYELWKEIASNDAAPLLLMDTHGTKHAIAALPENAIHMIALLMDELQVPEFAQEDYCTALLLSVRGWAGACAFRRWEAKLNNTQDDTIVELLAARAAWELVLWRRVLPPEGKIAWKRAQHDTTAVHELRNRNEANWKKQRALEYAYQQSLIAQLAQVVACPSAETTEAQVVFCIDVRSEPFRRALECVAPRVQTMGFAGFFGAPLRYVSLNGNSHAQVPGLLAPKLNVSDAGASRPPLETQQYHQRTRTWRKRRLSQSALFSFPWVELTGSAAFVQLLNKTFGLKQPDSRPWRTREFSGTDSDLVPRIVAQGNGDPLSLSARVDLAAGFLRGVSLTANFAPLLVLLGHGASTTNNPQAASLACGACGGHSGEINARVMAGLLNDPNVRSGLRKLGIDVPASTFVIGGVHDTTTDEVQLFNDEADQSHVAQLKVLTQQLAQAGHVVRTERAVSLHVKLGEPAALLQAMRARASDWSEVRPEWGLARNAAFIIAPRARTKPLDLQGRAFLHDYAHADDPKHGTLEAIMTAPMLVTHWINMQYYASVVDNTRWGSGDKTLHNVVGGHIGVLEGAGGDLRPGLPLQSLHDGTDWYHEPLRLSVFIEAPASAIDSIIAKHEIVKQLVDGEWLFLFQIDPHTNAIHERRGGLWYPVS